jgi:hypothetical protein
MDMRAGTERLLARVVQVFGAAQAHHGYLFANARATRIKLLVHDGFGVWCASRRLNAGSFVWPKQSVDSCCRTGGTGPTKVRQAAQTRRVNNAAMRWPMHTTKAPVRSHRASRVIAAMPFIAITLVMHAMVRRSSSQIKMPRPDAYRWSEKSSIAPATPPGMKVSAQGSVPTYADRNSD